MATPYIKMVVALIDLLKRVPYPASLYTLLLLLLLLFPFDFTPPVSDKENRATRLENSNGIDFHKYGMIKSRSPARGLHRALTGSGSLSVEVWIKSKKKRQYGPARIISLSRNKYLRNFTLGQDGAGLVFRLRTTETSRNGQPEFRVDDVIEPAKPVHIVVTYDRRKTTLYMDGESILTLPSVNGSLANWDPEYFLAFGNELTGGRPWQGVIYKAALYDRVLTGQEAGALFRRGWSPPQDHGKPPFDPLSLHYFDENRDTFSNNPTLELKLDLFAPEVLKRSNKVFLRPPFEDYVLNFKNLKDLVINILAFIPFGYLFCMQAEKKGALKFKAVLMILVAGTLFPLCAEIIQYYLPSRSSSCTDIVNNFLGTLIGICLYRLPVPVCFKVGKHVIPK